jgi:hypothetical protein
LLAACFFLLAGSGCARLAINPMIDSVNRALERQDDLQLVLDGAPSLLLVLDGFIADDPDNPRLLLQGAKSYASYAGILDEKGEHARAARLSGKGKDYGLRLLRRQSCLADSWPETLVDLDRSLTVCRGDDVTPLFWAGLAWGTWIGMQEGAPAAMVELPWVVRVMERVVELDDAYYYGGAHLFLGMYHASLPPALGGRPELSRNHFETALALAERRFLLAQVWYAETYARMTMDRDLFEKLLTEVLARPPDLAPELATANQLAAHKARKLLDEVEHYF